MGIIGIIMVLGVGIVCGMYITTQIAESIDRNIRSKKFLKDMEDYDKKK